MKFLLVAMLSVMLSACAGMTTKNKIAAACESAASGLEAVTAAKNAGRVSNAQLGESIALYKRVVVPNCLPVPDSLSSANYAALVTAAAELYNRAGAAK